MSNLQMAGQSNKITYRHRPTKPRICTYNSHRPNNHYCQKWANRKSQ